MWKTVILYAGALSVGALALEWTDYRRATGDLPTEAFVVVVALAFTGLGAWVGVQLTRRRTANKDGFQRNAAAAKALGVTDREFDVLELVATGRSNKEIARALGLSPNTVKTHLSNLFGKLGVGRRNHAVHAARALSLIP